MGRTHSPRFVPRPEALFLGATVSTLVHFNHDALGGTHAQPHLQLPQPDLLQAGQLSSWALGEVNDRIAAEVRLAGIGQSDRDDDVRLGIGSRFATVLSGACKCGWIKPGSGVHLYVVNSR